MTALHRYCPDHDPERALCGSNLAGATEVGTDDVESHPLPVCVVCADLCPQACQDACLGARSWGGVVNPRAFYVTDANGTLYLVVPVPRSTAVSHRLTYRLTLEDQPKQSGNPRSSRIPGALKPAISVAALAPPAPLACPDDPDGQHHIGCGCEA